MNEDAKQGGEAGFADLALDVARRLGPWATGLAVVWLLMPAIGGFALLGLAAAIQEWVQAQGTLGLVVYALLFAMLTGVALMPTYAMSGVAGFFFGAAFGSGAAMFGVVFGSLIGYVVAGALARKGVMGAIEASERARIVRRALVDRGLLTQLWLVTLIRFPPNSPFAMTNLVMSTTRVPLVPYAIGTAVGIAPRTLLAVFIGAAAAEAAQGLTKDALAQDAWVKWAGIAVGIAIFFALIQVFGRWARNALAAELEQSDEQRTDADRSTA